MTATKETLFDQILRQPNKRRKPLLIFLIDNRIDPNCPNIYLPIVSETPGFLGLSTTYRGYCEGCFSDPTNTNPDLPCSRSCAIWHCSQEISASRHRKLDMNSGSKVGKKIDRANGEGKIDIQEIQAHHQVRVPNPLSPSTSELIQLMKEGKLDKPIHRK